MVCLNKHVYGICLTEQIHSVGQTVIQARVTPLGEINHEIPARQSLKFLHVQTIYIATAASDQVSILFILISYSRN